MVALMLSGGLAFAFALVGTPLLIGWLRARGIGQQIREESPEGHRTKAGTPTMGGVMIVASATLGYTVSHVRQGAIFTRGGLLVLLAVLATALVGLLDDWLKVSRQQSLGLNKRGKIIGQVIVAGGFALLALEWANVETSLSFTRVETIDVDLGRVGWAVWAIVLVVATSNAVNLTDGLDGLAAGSSAFGFAAYAVIGFWLFRHPETYEVPQALDLALAAVALGGGCAGFLWWNAAPARIFMGDTGSLAMGAGLAALALVTNTHLLLPVIGGIFVLETLSVMVQVATFHALHRRVFRMAPIHHHFELGGWPETTVIVRFWILAALFTALALGIFYADSISAGVTG